MVLDKYDISEWSGQEVQQEPAGPAGSGGWGQHNYPQENLNKYCLNAET